METTEKAMCDLIDTICYKLDGGALAQVYKNNTTIGYKLETLNHIVDSNMMKYDRTKEIESLTKTIDTLRKTVSGSQESAVKLEEENKTLKEEINAQYGKIKEQSQTIEEQQRKILGQQQKITQLQQQLAKHTAPKTKAGNKNAYKSGADPEQVFMDIELGMSITKAADKYHVSRETIRKRYEEGKQRIESNRHGI